MSLHIVKPGVCTTIQDGGRKGYRASGITAGGAMDILAAAIANYITGNDATEAVIEMSFPAPVIVFEQKAVIAIAGALFSPVVNGVPVKNCQPIFVKPGDTLAFEQKEWGAWAYLSVRGGFALPKWLGSYATYLPAAVGGFKGRTLQKDDVLEYKKATSQGAVSFKWRLADKEWRQWYDADNAITVLEGNEWCLLDGASKERIVVENFTVTNQSNRMGYRLLGPLLQLTQPVEMVSSAVTKGTVQLLPSGDCIVLMADHQTTGGYPRMAHVTGSALPAMAQAQGSNQIKFRPVSIKAAEEGLFSMQQWLQQVRWTCMGKYGDNV